MNKDSQTWPAAILATGLLACGAEPGSEVLLQKSGQVNHPELTEISGLQASRAHPGVFWVHNDDGAPDLWAIDAAGTVIGRFRIEGARNRDWEDITLVPRVGADLLVLADAGDNHAQYSAVQMYFVAEPASPRARGGRLPIEHRLALRYPDGARDVEAVAFDPLGDRLLLLSKRDRPPRLYAVELAEALASGELTAVRLGDVDSLRPPALSDTARFGERAGWISQPTGMDISPDGSRAAIITYRSLYLFERPAGGDWLKGLRAEPLEMLAPPGHQDEAVGFTADGRELFVVPEGSPAPVYRFVFAQPEPASTP